MRRLIRICLLIAAFVGGCHVQNWLAAERCAGQGGRWQPSQGDLPGGVCLGLKAK